MKKHTPKSLNDFYRKKVKDNPIPPPDPLTQPWPITLGVGISTEELEESLQKLNKEMENLDTTTTPTITPPVLTTKDIENTLDKFKQIKEELEDITVKRPVLPPPPPPTRINYHATYLDKLNDDILKLPEPPRLHRFLHGWFKRDYIK